MRGPIPATTRQGHAQQRKDAQDDSANPCHDFVLMAPSPSKEVFAGRRKPSRLNPPASNSETPKRDGANARHIKRRDIHQTLDIENTTETDPSSAASPIPLCDILWTVHKYVPVHVYVRVHVVTMSCSLHSSDSLLICNSISFDSHNNLLSAPRNVLGGKFLWLSCNAFLLRT